MQYTVEIELALPRERVIELFDDPENMPRWQRGLLSFEPLSGTPGQPGAKSRLVYQMGKRRVEMIETITERDLPECFSGTYDGKNVHNVVRNRFVELAPDRTRWISENEFRFQGLMKLMGVLMKGAFPKQSLKYLQDFKAFAEQGRDVRSGVAPGDS